MKLRMILIRRHSNLVKGLKKCKVYSVGDLKRSFVSFELSVT